MPKLGWRREFGTIALLAVVVIAVVGRDHRFLDPTSLNSVLLWIPLLLVVGVGEMLVIVTRGIDVSVGSILGFSGIVVGMALRSNPGMNVELAALLGLGIGLALGAVNGALVAWARVPPIIATLGTLSAFRGLVFIVSHGVQVDSNTIPPALTDWSMSGPVQIGGATISWLLLIALVVAALAAAVLRSTRFGRNVFAIGSNPAAAKLRGISLPRTLMAVYCACGALSGLAGVLYASRYGFVNPGTAGLGFELTVIAAVVIGGVNVFGGSGSVLGVFLGCLLLSVINVALAVLGISATWQTLAYGVVILLALVLDGAVQRVLRRATEAR